MSRHHPRPAQQSGPSEPRSVDVIPGPWNAAESASTAGSSAAGKGSAAFNGQPTGQGGSAEQGWFAAWGEAWDRFWFTPADPIPLAIVRIVAEERSQAAVTAAITKAREAIAATMEPSPRA